MNMIDNATHTMDHGQFCKWFKSFDLESFDYAEAIEIDHAKALAEDAKRRAEMTNGDIVSVALRELGRGWHTSREIMWQVRRNGFQMTTARARGIAKWLYRADRAYMLVYGGRYSFEVKRETVSE